MQAQHATYLNLSTPQTQATTRQTVRIIRPSVLHSLSLTEEPNSRIQANLRGLEGPSRLGKKELHRQDKSHQDLRRHDLSRNQKDLRPNLFRHQKDLRRPGRPTTAGE